jgi:hypothetical protein
MWDVPDPDLYLATLRKSHSQFVFLEVLKDGEVVASMQSGVISDPQSGLITNSIGGSISVSQTTIRRSGTVNLIDVSGKQIPDSADDLFAPFVTELRVWVGVNYWDGSGSCLIPIVTMIITNVDAAYPQISLTGYDRMWTLGTFSAPYSIAAGTNIATALTDLLSANVPSSRFTINFSGGTSEDVTTALLYDVDTPVSDAAFALAELAGWDLYCDPVGTFTAANQPTTDDDPVITYQVGPGSLLSARPKISIASPGELYNAVIFTGEGGATGTTPFRGYAEDNDPKSLSYVARVGTRILFASSPLITTQSMADKAAKTRLSSILGIADTLTVPIIPNHALEVGDVIHVISPEQNIDEKVIIDSFSAPLRASDGAMELSCRARIIR